MRHLASLVDRSVGIRVVVAEPDPRIRRPLVLLVDGQDEMAVVGEEADESGVVAAVEGGVPDVLLLAQRLASRSCIEGAKNATPGLGVVVVGPYLEGMTRALAAGADQYLLSDSTAERLVVGIRLAAARARFRATRGRPRHRSG